MITWVKYFKIPTCVAPHVVQYFIIGFAFVGIAAFLSWFALRMGPEGFRVALAMAIVLPAAVMATMNSPWIVPYFWVIVAANRELRRVLDWLAGEYDPRTVISVVPLAVGTLMGIPIAVRWGTINRRLRMTLIMFMFVLLYGMAIGFRSGLAALMELTNWVVAMFALALPIAMRPSVETVDRWIRSLVVVGLVVSIYGWIQFLLLPPWDAMWMLASGMASIGKVKPMEFRVFGPLNAPAPFAMFVGMALVPSLVSSRWRPLGWITPAVIGAMLLLTCVRSMWIVTVVSLLVYTSARGGVEGIKRAMLIVGFTGLLFLAIPHLPGGDRVLDRASTFRDLQSDRSLQARTGIAVGGIQRLFSRPFGTGLGSTGVAAGLGSGAVVMDNGYLMLGFAFGIPGAIVLLIALGRVGWEMMSRVSLVNGGAEIRCLGIAMFGGMLVHQLANNVMTEGVGFARWLLIGAAICVCVPSRAVAPIGVWRRDIQSDAPSRSGSGLV